MKNFNKRMAAREGFTLVELIVVIAILAILAAVAYPAYTGYIDKANNASALQQFSGILTSAQAFAANDAKEVGSIEVTISSTDGKITNIVVKDSNSTEISLDEQFYLLLTGKSGVNDVSSANLSVNKDSTFAKAGGATWTPGGSWEEKEEKKTE